MADINRQMKNYLRLGIQEAQLCSEFVLQYLEKGPERDQILLNTEKCVENYCLLDNRLEIRPDIIAKMTAEEQAKLSRRENSEERDLPDLPENAIPDYNEKLSNKIMEAMQKTNVRNHEKLLDFQKKMKKLLNTTDGTGEDDDLMVTDESNNLVDPLTKQELIDPVISIKCKHRFSRASITEHLRGKGASQCPYVGCRVKFSADDFEDDIIAAQTLRRMELQRQI